MRDKAVESMIQLEIAIEVRQALNIVISDPQQAKLLEKMEEQSSKDLSNIAAQAKVVEILERKIEQELRLEEQSSRPQEPSVIT